MSFFKKGKCALEKEAFLQKQQKRTAKYKVCRLGRQNLWYRLVQELTRVPVVIFLGEKKFFFQFIFWATKMS